MRKIDCCKLALSLLLCTALPAMAAELQLGELMQMLAQAKSAKATFIEKKYIGIVDKPVESSGELSFTAPDKLEKRTLKPKAESLVLDGDALTVDIPGKRRTTIKLQDYPEVAAFVESIRGTLAGDRSALERVYKLELSGHPEKWLLVLTPTQAKMSKIVTRIRMQGSHSEIKSIDFDQADGDRSEMLVTSIQAQ
ncbi:LolA-related protein [Uliginosibacterium gangwonense]|uniref:LolA-related protein n=1 Tax=Uliginosibacterium gangwonense TaxID=392736 RepID=UPI00037FED3A|nr:LolA-related protein [Uliginosibacterium gangwonense]